MRIPAPLAVVPVTLLAAVAGCAGTAEDTESEIGTIRTAPPEPTEPELPEVEPVVAADCPYLDDDEVPDLGSGPVEEVRIDDRVDPPACFFSDADGAVQLTTTVYTVDSAERAAELVEQSAPPEYAVPLEVDDWRGGSTEGPGGALAALAGGDRVLAVQSAGEDPEPVREVAGLIVPRLD